MVITEKNKNKPTTTRLLRFANMQRCKRIFQMLFFSSETFYVIKKIPSLSNVLANPNKCPFCRRTLLDFSSPQFNFNSNSDTTISTGALMWSAMRLRLCQLQIKIPPIPVNLRRFGKNVRGEMKMF